MSRKLPPRMVSRSQCFASGAAPLDCFVIANKIVFLMLLSWTNVSSSCLATFTAYYLWRHKIQLRKIYITYWITRYRRAALDPSKKHRPWIQGFWTSAQRAQNISINSKQFIYSIFLYTNKIMCNSFVFSHKSIVIAIAFYLLNYCYSNDHYGIIMEMLW